MKYNHFSIVISTRNAVNWIERCLQSVCSQDYPDFEVIFLDAESTDGTFEKAKDFASKIPHCNIQILRNEKRKYQGENILIGTKMSPPKSIIATVDGDDWLSDNSVLQRLNAEYNKYNCYMTHGSYCDFFGDELPLRDVSWHYKKFPKEIIDSKTYRQYKWNSSHLRTWRRELFLHIKEEDMKDKLTGDFVAFAPDQTFMYSLLELSSGKENRIRFIPEVLYIYNRANENNESKINQTEIDRIEQQFRSKPVYPSLEKLYDDE